YQSRMRRPSRADYESLPPLTHDVHELLELRLSPKIGQPRIDAREEGVVDEAAVDRHTEPPHGRLRRSRTRVAAGKHAREHITRLGGGLHLRGHGWQRTLDDSRHYRGGEKGREARGHGLANFGRKSVENR